MSAAEWCEVDKILDDRFRKNQTEYLVKWKESSDDEGESETDWVPVNLCNCPISIAEYERSIGKWQDRYEVEGIIDSIQDPHGNVEYLVKWEDFDSATESTWVKEEDMDCNHLIQQFDAGHPYRDDDILLVDRIVECVGVFRGVENYTIVKQGSDEPTDEIYTLDELYIAANGRRALCQFKKRFF